MKGDAITSVRASGHRPESPAGPTPPVVKSPVSGALSKCTPDGWNKGDAHSVLSTWDGSDRDTAELMEGRSGSEPGKGCWHVFTRFVGGMWATRELTTKENREVFVRTTIRELVVYCIFLTILCILTFGMTSTTLFYYTQVMKGLFSQQSNVAQVADFWQFAGKGLMDSLYWEYAYNNGDDRNIACPGGEVAGAGPCPLSPADRNILYENRLIGLPRLRQLRVRNDSCNVHEDFQNAIKVCYSDYSRDVEDTGPFGPGYRLHTSATAWKYQSSVELGGSPYWGQLGTYSGAGSYQDLSSLKNQSTAMVNELKEGLWIGRGTRFVAIDFTVYNANVNLFCIVKLTFEFPATGGVMPGTEFATVRLLRYVTSGDYFVMACEIVFVALVAYYVVEEALEIRMHRLSYFSSVWNLLDLLVVVVSAVCIGFTVYSSMLVNSELVPLLQRPDQFADFTFLGFWSEQNTNAMAICVFFAWVKLFKYISFNKTMTQLSSTLSRCAKDVAGFGIMFLIVFFAFAQLGYLLFGTQVEDYSSLDSAIFSLLRLILGDFNFDDIETAHRVLGPIFFISYVFFVFFVLLNMFLAIINDTYSEVKAELVYQKNEFEIGDYFRRGYNNILGKMGSRSKAIDIENALKLATARSGTITYEELRQNLKKCNFSDMEIEMFFVQYDKDGNFTIDPDEAIMVLNDLNNGRSLLGPSTAPPAGGHGIMHDARPKSGKEARSARAERIMSMAGGIFGSISRGGISLEEFNV